MQYNIIFYLFLVFWKHLVKIIIYSAPVFHNHKPQARYTVFTVKIFVFESLPPQLIFCYPASHLLMLHLGMLHERNQTLYCIHGNINGLVGQTVKNLPAKWETQGWPLGQVDPLEKGIILAWRIPRTEEPGGPQSIGSQRRKHNWVTNTLTFYLSSTSYGSGTQHLHSSVQFSSSVVSDSLRPHGLQHTRLPCPLPVPGVYPNSCPSSRWCHPAISSSVVPFSSCLQSCPASRSFPMSQFLASGGRSFSFSTSPSNEYSGLISFRIDWFDLLAVQGTLKSLLRHHNSKASGWQLTALTYSFPNLEPVCCFMSGSNYCFLTCIQISQETCRVVWYSRLFKNFPQLVVIHTVKTLWHSQ